MIHTISLEKFDNNIKSLVKYLKGKRKLLASCGESESSILAILLRVLKKSPSSVFNSFIGGFQDKYNDGTKIDLDDFMRNIVMKYELLVEDGQWDTKSEKYADILSLTSQIQEPNILFTKQSTYQDRNKNINVGNTSFNNSGNTWKSTALISGESWTKEKTGHTFHWCKWHEYWTATHNQNNFRIPNLSYLHLAPRSGPALVTNSQLTPCSDLALAAAWVDGVFLSPPCP